MPSHFASIGMHLESPSEYDALIERIISDTEAFEVPDGRYLKWSSECGAELWIQANSKNEVIGATPYFAGHSRVRIGITSREILPEYSELDGSFRGWTNPPDDGDPELGETTPVFQAPDFCRYADLKLRSTATASIAAFGYDVALFDSVAAFKASRPRITSTSFFPWDIDNDDEPVVFRPYATITGLILKEEVKANELTGQRFHWVLIDSYAGIFDIVFEPELIATSPDIWAELDDSWPKFDTEFLGNSPKVGGVLSGSFWLSGRLTQYTKT